jgi:asparagine synthase (glutamine-hydrolysing)
MTAIAGIALPAKKRTVNKMLDKMTYRGPDGRVVIQKNGVTLGMDWSTTHTPKITSMIQEGMVADRIDDGHFAQAQAENGTITLTRDPLGVAPLYYGFTNDGALCFASEVKGLTNLTQNIHELAPGTKWVNGKTVPYFRLKKAKPLGTSSRELAAELRLRLEKTVEQSFQKCSECGSWLSGGLDSSTMAALARPHTRVLHTFAAGFPGASDLHYARIVADHIGAQHHELLVNIDELLRALPDVIFHLESFDALLVRSSMMNYLVAKLASDFVPAVFSGEGGDELFAGYSYLKSINPDDLSDELVDIIARLHNTALQRVDRCAGAHGTVAFVGFLDPGVVDLALQIPVDYKLHNGVEKWILRQAVADLLPPDVLNREKAKFWEGAGVTDILAQYANQHISDKEFTRQRTLPNGWKLNSKEEYFYYKIFKEHFGEMKDLGWMGRTKGAPGQEI